MFEKAASTFSTHHFFFKEASTLLGPADVVGVVVCFTGVAVAGAGVATEEAET